MKEKSNIHRSSLLFHEKIIHSFLDNIIVFFAFIFKKKRKKFGEHFHEDSSKYKRYEGLYLLYKQFRRDEGGEILLKTHIQKKIIDENKEVILLFLGDIIPYQNLDTHSKCQSFQDILPYIQESDVIIANMESPLVHGNVNMYSSRLLLGHIDHAMTIDYFAKYQSLFPLDKIKVLSLANNHSRDLGKDGFIYTKNFLEKQGFLTTGGKIKSEEKSYTIIDIKGLSIGFLSYTYSLNHHRPKKDDIYMVNHIALHEIVCDLTPICDEVMKVREQGCNVIVLLLHIGNAYQRMPTKFIKNRIREIFIATGADIIVCNHAHNLQPCEIITYNYNNGEKKGLVAYALGDMIGDNALFSNKLSGILQVGITPSGITSFDLHPYITLSNTHSIELQLLSGGLQYTGDAKKDEIIDYFNFLK